jgi:DNA-binding Lrp family transcriptional regulator
MQCAIRRDCGASPGRGRGGCEVGKVAHVTQALSDLDGVQSAEDLAGPYDVIARVQASGLDRLGRLVVSRIQVVDGITRTLTCMVIHR